MSYLRVISLLSLVLITTSIALKAQPVKPADHGLKEFTLKDAKLGLIRFYVDTINIKKKQPFFIEVNGSGGLPLCIFIKGKGFGSIYNTLNEQLKAVIQKDFHYIILGKPGTPFCDTIKTNEDAKHFDAHQLIANYKYSAGYTRQLSLNWRVAATKKVITYLIKQGYWDGTKIAAYGYSEGGQVVPSLAVADKRITHVIAVVGSGLNQFYDGIMAWRVKAAKGKVTQQQAQDSIDVELKRIKDIYANPGSTHLQYGGHTYKRWASFGLNPPFEKLRMLNIPIYMIVATADESSPIYGLDYVQLDFIRLGKKNLTYEPCVGCDHYLNKPDADKTSQQDYNSKILKWLSK
ncbi:alpha/beta hydrolase family protein [Mucilaginibacter sp. UYCu711]|uniref:alpha/beta hydrolase family protein n=1 Tax=Mucilaginibacter sp. UYCu711 TaxID=3156339 RepID=UPI003D19DB8A